MRQTTKARPANFKFRRQHPAGPYVIDFYCAMEKLGIEIDGIAHEMGNNPARDERRDLWLRERGYRILRISASELRTNAEGVIQHILYACAALPLHHATHGPPPHPLRGQGGKN
jgi:very-short-patch-repair endonuclease